MNQSKGKARPKTSGTSRPKSVNKVQRANTTRRSTMSKTGNFATVARIGKDSLSQNDSSTVLQHAAPQLNDILEKDEFVADVLGSNGTGNIVITTYPFNPGQSSLFPLGASEAAKWTNWRCISAEPYLLHQVSEFATDGSTGKVIIACDYNSANAAPTTKQQLEDMHSASCMPSQDVGLKLIPRLLNRADPKYVRTGTQPFNTDIRLYDGGNVYVASSGQAGNSKVSELRIRYKFQLELPTLLNAVGAGGSYPRPVFYMKTPGPQGEASGATTVPKALFTSANNPVVVVNQIGATVAATGIITLPIGQYSIEGSVTAWNGSVAVSAQTAYFSTDAGTAESFRQHTQFAIPAGGNAGGNTCQSSTSGPVVIDTTAISSTVTFLVTNTYASGSTYNEGFIRIIQL